jgi:hypothetical protein
VEQVGVDSIQWPSSASWLATNTKGSFYQKFDEITFPTVAINKPKSARSSCEWVLDRIAYAIDGRLFNALTYPLRAPRRASCC